MDSLSGGPDGEERTCCDVECGEGECGDWNARSSTLTVDGSGNND